MASVIFLDTKTVNLNEILGNGKIYRVPQFQRDYSWNKDNWEDLWNDIQEADKTKIAHYMGSIVFQSLPGKEYSIIDGQQRITTLIILILAIIDALNRLSEQDIDREGNQERVKILMRQYIGQKDPASLTYSSKLFLNENNDAFFQHRLILFADPPNISKLSDSEKLIWEAYQFFKDRIKQGFRNYTGSDYASFVNKVSGELMMFIQITVEDELNAFTVIETLNSRGVELTSADLLKNFLFSLVARRQTDLKQIKVQWDKIIDLIGLRDFPNFLRYYLIGTRKLITREYLFREVKTFINSSQDVFNLLDTLESYAYNYTALGNPDDDIWNPDRGNCMAISILKAFRVTQWKTLAMVVMDKSGTQNNEFRRLLKSIVTLTFRYNIISKLQTNEMEKVFSTAGINYYNKKSRNLEDILNDLKALYLNDEDFKSYFKLKQFNTKNTSDKKLARYTLYQLEAQEEGGIRYDFETDNGTIEHILPESYPEVWKTDFTEEEFQHNVSMIGNLTLLEENKNKQEAGNKSFHEKR